MNIFCVKLQQTFFKKKQCDREGVCDYYLK